MTWIDFFVLLQLGAGKKTHQVLLGILCFESSNFLFWKMTEDKKSFLWGNMRPDKEVAFGKKKRQTWNWELHKKERKLSLEVRMRGKKLGPVQKHFNKTKFESNIFIHILVVIVI